MDHPERIKVDFRGGSRLLPFRLLATVVSAVIVALKKMGALCAEWLKKSF